MFDYPGPEAAVSQAEQIDLDGSSIGANMGTGLDASHFYMQGKLIVLSVGNDASTFYALKSTLGERFARI